MTAFMHMRLIAPAARPLRGRGGLAVALSRNRLSLDRGLNRYPHLRRGFVTIVQNEGKAGEDLSKGLEETIWNTLQATEDTCRTRRLLLLATPSHASLVTNTDLFHTALNQVVEDTKLAFNRISLLGAVVDALPGSSLSGKIKEGYTLLASDQPFKFASGVGPASKTEILKLDQAPGGVYHQPLNNGKLGNILTDDPPPEIQADAYSPRPKSQAALTTSQSDNIDDQRCSMWLRDICVIEPASSVHPVVGKSDNPSISTTEAHYGHRDDTPTETRSSEPQNGYPILTEFPSRDTPPVKTTKIDIKLKLANTLFQTGDISTAIFREWRYAEAADPGATAKTPERKLYVEYPLADVSVIFPEHVKFAAGISLPLTPLTTPRKIASGNGNIITQLEGSGEQGRLPASRELEVAVKTWFDKRPAYKEGTYQKTPVFVFARITEEEPEKLAGEENQGDEVVVELFGLDVKDSRKGYIRRVLSGGGGWGDKAGLIALDPHGITGFDVPGASFGEEFGVESAVKEGMWLQFFIVEVKKNERFDQSEGLRIEILDRDQELEGDYSSAPVAASKEDNAQVTDELKYGWDSVSKSRWQSGSGGLAVEGGFWANDDKFDAPGGQLVLKPVSEYASTIRRAGGKSTEIYFDARKKFMADQRAKKTRDTHFTAKRHNVQDPGSQNASQEMGPHLYFRSIRAGRSFQQKAGQGLRIRRHEVE